jgi:hypothetical protein
LSRPIAIERGSPSWRLMMRFCSSSSLARPRFPSSISDVVHRHGQFRAITGGGAQIERGLEAAPGLGSLAQVALGRSEHGGREGQVLARLERFEDAHRLPGLADRLGVVTALRGQHGGRAQGSPEPPAFLR